MQEPDSGARSQIQEQGAEPQILPQESRSSTPMPTPITHVTTWKTSRTGCHQIGVTMEIVKKYPKFTRLNEENLKNQFYKSQGTTPAD